MKERDRRGGDERWKMKTGVNEQSDNVKREEDSSSTDQKTLTSNYTKLAHNMEQKHTEVPVKMKAGNIYVAISPRLIQENCL